MGVHLHHLHPDSLIFGGEIFMPQMLVKILAVSTPAMIAILAAVFAVIQNG